MFVVLFEASPGQYLLAGTYDTADVETAYGNAAAEFPQSDVFYAAALEDFVQDRVASRHTVIEWESASVPTATPPMALPPETTTPPTP